MAMRVLFINPMYYGANAGIDAIAHGLQYRLKQDGIELRTLWADFREPGWQDEQAKAVRAGTAAAVDAIVIYALSPDTPAEAATEAREQGIPLFAFERPHYRVNGSVIYPNFNHGVLMSEYLASLLPKGAKVAIIGGPDVVDDIELGYGLVHGAKQAGLTVVNDPFDERYKNPSDVAEQGRVVTLRILDDFSDIEGLIPYNDETMHGSVEALRERGVLGTIKTVSRNGTPKAVEAVKAGYHHGTWDLDCVGIGTAAGELVVRQLVRGESLDDEISMSPVGRMVGLREAETWLPPWERVPYDPLHEGLD
jgi:ABC-type sugar transport system substrate-binding protein